MSFHVRTRQGAYITDPDLDTVDRVLAELDAPVDPEHPDVALGHESGWCLTAYPSGLVIWENVEGGGEPRHRRLGRDELRELWLALAEGDVDGVEAHGWKPGQS